VKRRQYRTLLKLFAARTSGNISWHEVLALFRELGAEIDDRKPGSRVLVVLRGEPRVIHRPHPRPTLSRAQVDSIRDWLESLGIEP